MQWSDRFLAKPEEKDYETIFHRRCRCAFIGGAVVAGVVAIGMSVSGGVVPTVQTVKADNDWQAGQVECPVTFQALRTALRDADHADSTGLNVPIIRPPWRLRELLGLAPVSGNDGITLDNASGQPHCPNDTQTQGQS